MSDSNNVYVLGDSALRANYCQQKSACHALRPRENTRKMRAMKIGDVVRQRRKQLGLTLQETVARMDLEHDTGNLSKAERGEQQFALKTLESVARALNTTIPELYRHVDGHQIDAPNNLTIYLPDATLELVCAAAAVHGVTPEEEIAHRVQGSLLYPPEVLEFADQARRLLDESNAQGFTPERSSDLIHLCMQIIDQAAKAHGKRFHASTEFSTD